MCGIVGAFGAVNRAEFNDHIKNSGDLLNRRGPDQRNHIEGYNFHAVHSRLIIRGNTYDGVQPFKFNNII